MSALAGMRPEQVAKFVKAVCGGDAHAARAASLSNAVTGALASASLGVSAIGVGLAQARGTNAKHGVKQADRLPGNGRLDVWEWFGLWVPHVIGARGEVVVSLDWTSFAADGHEVVALSMSTGHGRSAARGLSGDERVGGEAEGGGLGTPTCPTHHIWRATAA